MNHRKNCTISVYKKGACHSKSYYLNNRERLGKQHPDYKEDLSSLSGDSQCLECGKIVQTKNMSRHMREKHPHPFDDFGEEYDENDTSNNEKLYKCDICDKKFRNARSIPSHVKKIHADLVK